MENRKTSAYYENRAVQFGVVSTEWLAQAQSATVPRSPSSPSPSPPLPPAHNDADKPFSVIEEFDTWRKHPDLAEAVAAIRALAAVIRSSKATTMMQLEIQLKSASDSLKVTTPILSLLIEIDFLIIIINLFCSVVTLHTVLGYNFNLLNRRLRSLHAIRHQDFRSRVRRLQFRQVSLARTRR